MSLDLQHAEQLLHHLAPDQIAAVVRFMENMLDPVSRSIAAAPVDEEPLTGEAIQAIEASKEWFRHNQGISHEEVLAEFGLKPETFPWNLGGAESTPH